MQSRKGRRRYTRHTPAPVRRRSLSRRTRPRCLRCNSSQVRPLPETSPPVTVFGRPGRRSRLCPPRSRDPHPVGLPLGIRNREPRRRRARSSRRRRPCGRCELSRVRPQPGSPPTKSTRSRRCCLARPARYRLPRRVPFRPDNPRTRASCPRGRLSRQRHRPGRRVRFAGRASPETPPPSNGWFPPNRHGPRRQSRSRGPRLGRCRRGTPRRLPPPGQSQAVSSCRRGPIEIRNLRHPCARRQFCRVVRSIHRPPRPAARPHRQPDRPMAARHESPPPAS